MEWTDFEYKDLAEKLSDAEVEHLVNVMISNYDKNGQWYDSSQAFKFLTAHVINSSFSFLLSEKVRHVFDDEENNGNYLYLYGLREINFDTTRNSICGSILREIIKVAEKKRAVRFFSRLNVGDNVNVYLCDSRSKYLNKYEFYKDGGWGIADDEGKVIISNHLKTQLSKSKRVLLNKSCPFLIIQDRDTERYGVLDVLSFKEVIHCLYEKIEVVDCSTWYKKQVKFLLKTKKNGKWGCYDDNCILIIDNLYDDIIITHYGIEGCRDGVFLHPEIDYGKYGRLYSGINDLYDFYGNLILGGYNFLEYDFKGFYKFYFGTKFMSYYEIKADLYGNEIELLKYKLNYDNSLCLVLDRNFETVIRSAGKKFSVPLGKVFQSGYNIDNYVSKEYLLSGDVNLEYCSSFILLEKDNKDSFIISDYREEYIGDFWDDNKKVYWLDNLIEDDEIEIIRIAADGSLLWRFVVNEVYGFIDNLWYRIGETVGRLSCDGVSPAFFAAVTTDNDGGKQYVAHILYQKLERIGDKINPNYISCRSYTIQYYQIKPTGELIKIDDDWNVFNPQKHRWFPMDFLERNGLDDYEDYYYEAPKSSYEKYGGYNGYDDDTIDYGFDGHAEATWNVD